jgi:hypothetical protein
MKRNMGAPLMNAAAEQRQTAAGRRYCLIAPCRDEEKYMERTLQSVLDQSEPPALFIVVDDGSTDRTPEILRQWQQKMPYLKIVTRADRGDRKLGGGVIDAFYAGYEITAPREFDYVCKLDLDLELPPTYFATLMDKMAADPRLASLSGKPYMELDGRLVSEKCGDENSVGMAKFYRSDAFEQIGGFVRELMWDGIDCHTARLYGWKTGSLDEPALRFTHLRPMGTSHKNWWTGRVRHGWGQHFMGTGPSYMLASAAYRMTRPPLVVGGLAMLWGYGKRAVSREPRYAGPDGFRKLLNRWQWASLIKGKRRATEALDAQQADCWQPPAKHP